MTEKEIAIIEILRNRNRHMENVLNELYEITKGSKGGDSVSAYKISSIALSGLIRSVIETHYHYTQKITGDHVMGSIPYGFEGVRNIKNIPRAMRQRYEITHVGEVFEGWDSYRNNYKVVCKKCNETITEETSHLKLIIEMHEISYHDDNRLQPDAYKF